MGTFAEANSRSRKFISKEHRMKSLAKDLFIESLLKPDHELRNNAKEQGCLDELIEWRDLCLDWIRRTSDFPR